MGQSGASVRGAGRHAASTRAQPHTRHGGAGRAWLSDQAGPEGRRMEGGWRGGMGVRGAGGRGADWLRSTRAATQLPSADSDLPRRGVLPGFMESVRRQRPAAPDTRPAPPPPPYARGAYAGHAGATPRRVRVEAWAGSGRAAEATRLRGVVGRGGAQGRGGARRRAYEARRAAAAAARGGGHGPRRRRRRGLAGSRRTRAVVLNSKELIN